MVVVPVLSRPPPAVSPPFDPLAMSREPVMVVDDTETVGPLPIAATPPPAASAEPLIPPLVASNRFRVKVEPVTATDEERAWTAPPMACASSPVDVAMITF